jgi:hypothetical protein
LPPPAEWLTDNRSTLPSTAFSIRIRKANTSGLKFAGIVESAMTRVVVL